MRFNKPSHKTMELFVLITCAYLIWCTIVAYYISEKQYKPSNREIARTFWSCILCTPLITAIIFRG